MKSVVRKAIKCDAASIVSLIEELAIFEKEPEAVAEEATEEAETEEKKEEKAAE